MTLLSLASKQIWPQVLGFLHLSPRPDRLILFHTDEEAESAGPARRLKEFFASQRLLSEAVELVRVPHDHFGNIVEGLASTAERLQLDESNCRVHLTGGNKLMPLQAAEFARSRNVPVVLKDRLISDLRPILFPNEPAALDQLHSLAMARTGATA